MHATPTTHLGSLLGGGGRRKQGVAFALDVYVLCQLLHILRRPLHALTTCARAHTHTHTQTRATRTHAYASTATPQHTISQLLLVQFKVVLKFIMNRVPEKRFEGRGVVGGSPPSLWHSQIFFPGHGSPHPVPQHQLEHWRQQLITRKGVHAWMG